MKFEISYNEVQQRKMRWKGILGKKSLRKCTHCTSSLPLAALKGPAGEMI